MSERKHSHYFKSVEGLKDIDVYRVLQLFNVTDPCLQHTVKKLLVAGGRGGGKDITRDIQEAIDKHRPYRGPDEGDTRQVPWLCLPVRRQTQWKPLSETTPEDRAIHGINYKGVRMRCEQKGCRKFFWFWHTPDEIAEETMERLNLPCPHCWVKWERDAEIAALNKQVADLKLQVDNLSDTLKRWQEMRAEEQSTQSVPQ